MGSLGVLFVTTLISLDPALLAQKASVMPFDQPDTRRAQLMEAKPRHFAFLRQVKGQTHAQVLAQLGHPASVERAPNVAERWTYNRTDGKLFWVFFQSGRAILGMPTEGFHIGGPEVRW